VNATTPQLHNSQKPNPRPKTQDPKRKIENPSSAFGVLGVGPLGVDWALGVVSLGIDTFHPPPAYRPPASIRRLRRPSRDIGPYCLYCEAHNQPLGCYPSVMTDLAKDLAALRIQQEDRGGGRGRGVGVGLVVLVVLAAVGAGGWYWATALQAVSVKVAPVTARGGNAAAPGAVLNASGYVVARRRATVSSKVTGKVIDVLLEEGQPVREGQILAHLDDTQPRATLALAEAQLASARKAAAEDQARLQQAEVTLQRRAALVKENVVGKAELDEAQSEVDSLKARIAYTQQQIGVAEQQVNLQKTMLADMVVRAPFSGVAISKDAQPGEMISPVSAGGGFTRTGVATIVDMTSLEI